MGFLPDTDPTSPLPASPPTPSRRLLGRYRRASFPQRVGALMVDSLLFFTLVAVPAWIISWIFGPGGMTGCESLVDDSCAITGESLRFTRTVFYALWAVWVLIFARSIAAGASAGKRAVEIMVVDVTTGETISYKRTIVRTMLAVVSVAVLGLGLLWSLTNKDRRAAHDLVMGTRVISN